MSEQESAAEPVQGERGATPVDRARSVQSRVSSVLAIGLMSVMGLGTLTWYYANAVMRQGRAQQSAQAASRNRAQGDMPLPSLGRIDPPAPLPAPPPAPSPWDAAPVEPAAVALSPTALTEIPLDVHAAQSGYAAPPEKTAQQRALERQLSGAVFLPQSGPQGPPGMPFATPPSGNSPQDAGELATLLRPGVTTAVRAQLLPTQRLLLPKGAFIDCTLETAIDSTLPGMTTCIMATDTFGVNGQVVLLERGTKLIGETRGQVQQGAARIFVLWNEARSPSGVVVPLSSPGADELGRSGLPGTVNRHFWERFGAAMLVSVIDGAVQSAAQSSRNGSAIIVNPSASQDVLTEVLKSTINIAPTVVKHHGDRIQVLVARDLDFRSVYELKSVATHR